MPEIQKKGNGIQVNLTPDEIKKQRGIKNRLTEMEIEIKELRNELTKISSRLNKGGL